MNLPCPVGGCESSRPSYKLMCAAHWRHVPRALSQEVYAAWRARTASEPGGRERHQAATDAAIAAVEARA